MNSPIIIVDSSSILMMKVRCKIGWQAGNFYHQAYLSFDSSVRLPAFFNHLRLTRESLSELSLSITKRSPESTSKSQNRCWITNASSHNGQHVKRVFDCFASK